MPRRRGQPMRLRATHPWLDELLLCSGRLSRPRDEGREAVTCGIVEILQLIAMKIHEYQAKALLARYGVPVPRGEVALTVDEAEAAAKAIGGSVAVKAQNHAGGRGKGGGVKVA